MRVSIVEDRRDGKHAAKVFFGCFAAPTGQEKEAKSKGAGCDKISKKYICRMFSKERDQDIKEGGEFRTSAGGLHDLDHQLEDLVNFSDQCDTTQVLL